MKTLGLLGGMSYESTAVYYHIINQEVQKKLGGSHSAKLVLYSFDYHELETYLKKNDMTAIENRCVEEGRKLLNHGAERIMLLANTIHLVSEGIEKRCHTKLIHIVEETYREVNKSSLKHVGLIGTAYTMQSGMYEAYFKPRGINVSVPKKEDQDIIHNIIYQELIKGVFLETSRQAILKIIDNMNVEGIILGCTELPMLIKEEDLQIKRYDTMMIHAKAAAEWMLQDE